MFLRKFITDQSKKCGLYVSGKYFAFFARIENLLYGVFAPVTQMMELSHMDN